MEDGVPVATRTTPPPKLDEKEQAAFIEKAKSLAPQDRSSRGVAGQVAIGRRYERGIMRRAKFIRLIA
jgi:hypothetical protein